MTDQELLQQAKDQVAQKHIEKFENWSALRMACRSAGKEFLIQAFLEDASLLAIQSAREEAYRYGFIDGDHEHNEMALEPCLQEYLKRINTAD